MKLFFVIAATFFFTGCKKSSTADDYLQEGNCINNIKGQGINICFDRLEQDSRCPVKSQCIWQGVAEAAFTIKKAQQIIQFKLATIKALTFVNDTTIMGVHITLNEVSPYPGEIGYDIKPKKVKLAIE